MDDEIGLNFHSKDCFIAQDDGWTYDDARITPGEFNPNPDPDSMVDAMKHGLFAPVETIPGADLAPSFTFAAPHRGETTFALEFVKKEPTTEEPVKRVPIVRDVIAKSKQRIRRPSGEERKKRNRESAERSRIKRIMRTAQLEQQMKNLKATNEALQRKNQAIQSFLEDITKAVLQGRRPEVYPRPRFDDDEEQMPAMPGNSQLE